MRSVYIIIATVYIHVLTHTLSMQSDSELNLTNWGMNHFQAANVVAFVCTDGGHVHLLNEEESEIALVHGAPVEIGFKITPPPGCTMAETFLDMWIQESKRITLDLDFQALNGETIPIGTSSIQTCSTYENDLNEKRIVFNRVNAETLYMSKVVVVQVDAMYTDANIKLSISTGVSVVQSKIPSVSRAGMAPEEQAIRAFLETGRYCPPRVARRQCLIAVRIVNAVAIMPWSRSVGMWTHVLGVTVSNTHPHKRLLIDDVTLVLDDTLLQENYVLSRPIISDTYDLRNLNYTKNCVDIYPNCSYTFAFQLKAKFIGMLEGDCGEMSASDLIVGATSISAVPTGLSAVATIPHVFKTPIKFKWRCERFEQGETFKKEQLFEHESQFADLLQQYLITSIDYLRWTACVPLSAGDAAAHELMIFAAAELQTAEKEVADSIFVDISGPSVTKPLVSFNVLIRVTNVTSEEKEMLIKIENRMSDVDLFEGTG